MDPSWANYGINCNLQYVPTADTSSNLDLANDGRGFKPKAYINPKLVNCTYSFSSVNNPAVSNRIHINPNFKPSYCSSTGAEPKTEICSVHINPYFCQTKTNFKISGEQKSDDLPVNTTLDEKEENKRNSVCIPVQRVQGCSEKEPSSYKSRNNLLSTNTYNSIYFWSKHNATPTSEPLQVSHQKPEIGGCTMAVTTKSTSMLSSNIKTRHKIVHGISSSLNVHKINRNMNSNLRLQNPYKIVNVGKSKLGNSPKSQHYSASKDRSQSIYSKNNLINISGKENLSDQKKAALSKMKGSNLNRTSYVNRITNLIRTKYIHPNKRKQLKLLSLGNYKLDKRKKPINLKKSANVKDVCGNALSFFKNMCLLKDKNWKSITWKPNKFKKYNSLVWRKQECSKKDLKRIGKSYSNETVVNIGGIMYKSTTNKLTRTRDKKQSSHQFSSKPDMTSCKNHRIVHVRGEKFLLGESGKTLIRQFNAGNTDGSSKCSVRRVDIGGVTFVQKSNGILIQTQTHQARQIVNYAKHKSIALLSSLHKRSNRPCMIYQKFGICRRHAKGMCIYIHDPKNVALCKKFLKGDCSDTHCLLSHDVVKEKIATCHFFLKGNCHRDNCPFLHVKVNNKAAICMDFLHGFCALGQDCKKRHIHQCPDFDEKESCNRGIKCPYPHRKTTKRKMKNSKTYKVSKFKLTNNIGNQTDEEVVDAKIKKTGKKRSKARKRKIKTEKCSSQDANNDQIVECIPKRVKLDDLPLFIPLNT